MGTQTILTDNRVHYFDSHYDEHHHHHCEHHEGCSSDPNFISFDVTKLFTGNVGESVMNTSKQLIKEHLYVMIEGDYIPVYVQQFGDLLGLYYEIYEDDLISRILVPVKEIENRIYKKGDTVKITSDASDGDNSSLLQKMQALADAAIANANAYTDEQLENFSSLPEHTTEDLGKVLTVTEDGVSWEEYEVGEGIPGTGIVSVEQIITSTEDSGANVITVTLSNGETSAFEVLNGSQGSEGPRITSIEKTGTDALIDTYTVSLSNDSSYTFNVTNGAPGATPNFRVEIDGQVQVSYDNGTTWETIGTARVEQGAQNTYNTYAVNVKANQTLCENDGDAYIDADGVLQILTDGEFQASATLKGKAFTYTDFSDEQLEALKVKGDPFTYDDFTDAQLEALKGEPGDDAFEVWKALEGNESKTKAEFFESLKGYTPQKDVDYFDGDSITISDQSLDASGNRVLTFSDNTTTTIPKGIDGITGLDPDHTSITIDNIGTISLQFNDGKLGIFFTAAGEAHPGEFDEPTNVVGYYSFDGPTNPAQMGDILNLTADNFRELTEIESEKDCNVQGRIVVLTTGIVAPTVAYYSDMDGGYGTPVNLSRAGTATLEIDGVTYNIWYDGNGTTSASDTTKVKFIINE